MRLIDADNFIEYLSAKRDICINYDDLLNAKVYQIAINEIKEADTIDAEPVVHGHWEKKYKSKYYRCSVCGGIVEDEWHNCPHCGAKMDEESEQE